MGREADLFRRELLEKLFAYKVLPWTDELPGKFETGTQNHEGIAGVLGAIEYFEWIGREFGNEHSEGLRKESLLKIGGIKSFVF
jgi:hypothetical protein